MSVQPFVGEIQMFAGTFAPKGWALCDGQLLPISQNTALFSLLGTTYGGNGQTNFALPDLRGRAPLQPGAAAGLSPYDLGQAGGDETVTLVTSQIPGHSHSLNGKATAATTGAPAGDLLAKTDVNAATALIYRPSGTSAQLNPQAIAPTGGTQPHNNMQPYLTVNFVIALQGIFPSRF